MICQEERDLTCDSCYELSIDHCDPVTINAGLIPVGYATVYLQIVDRFEARRTQEITIGVDGEFTVDETLLPDNFFNPYAGKFELYLTLDEVGLFRIDLTFSDVIYKCIILTIQKSQCTNIYVESGYVECAYVE
jgi:hypothetical protein